MVSLAQIQAGLTRYLDEEFVNKLTGWQKWVFGSFAGIALLRIDEIFNKLKQNDIVKMLNIIDDFDNIDIDILHREFSKQARKGAVTMSLPVVGTVTLNGADVDKLYQYIMEAN